MKSKYVVLASALLISVASCSKDEIKAAEKRLKKETHKKQRLFYRAESLISNARMMRKRSFSLKEIHTQI
jgi:hypothetical protein